MDYQNIPAGTYAATVTGSALGRTSGGKEQIAVSLDVHVNDRESGQMYPVQMTWYGFFTDAALQTTDKALAALGFDATQRDISELGPEQPHESPIVGAECEVVVEIERSDEYGDRPKIRWLNRRGGGLVMKERMDAVSAKAFGASLRSRLLAVRGPGASRSAAAPAPPQRPAAAPPRPAAPAGGRPAVPPARAPQGAAPPRQPGPPRNETGPRPGDPPPGEGWTDDIPF